MVVGQQDMTVTCFRILSAMVSLPSQLVDNGLSLVFEFEEQDAKYKQVRHEAPTKDVYYRHHLRVWSCSLSYAHAQFSYNTTG